MKQTLQKTLAFCALCAGLGCNGDMTSTAPTAPAVSTTGVGGAAAAPTTIASPPAATPTATPGTAAPSSTPAASGSASANTPSVPVSGATPSAGNSTATPPSGATPSAPEPATPPEGGAPPAAAGDPSVIDFQADIRGKCAPLNSGFPGDDACIPAPPAEMGMQIHVGPKDYADAAEVAKFIMHPGEESSMCWTFVTPNAQKIFYQTSTLSGRAGTHHIINTAFDAALPMGMGFEACGGDGSAAAVDSIPGASKSYMPRYKVAPEYAHVGRSLEANTTIQSDMHYFNLTDKDILREYWLNIYFVAEAEITEVAEPIRLLGGFSWNTELGGTPIEPGTDMVYAYECPITGNGFIMDLLGHYHAHGKRFTSTIKRKNGQIDKVFEMYDYLDPAMFQYNSVIENPAFAEGTAGAVSGQLPVSDGDILTWECRIVNDSDVPLTYVNEVQTGEMCNLWGSSVGIDGLNCFLP